MRKKQIIDEDKVKTNRQGYLIKKKSIFNIYLVRLLKW